MKAAARVLLVSSAVFSSSAAAQTCPFGRDVTVSGTIQGVDPAGAQKQLLTEIVPFRDCEIWIIGFQGALPSTCQKGRRFTATGRISHNLVLPDGVYGLMAARLSCQ